MAPSGAQPSARLAKSAIRVRVKIRLIGTSNLDMPTIAPRNLAAKQDGDRIPHPKNNHCVLDCSTVKMDEPGRDTLATNWSESDSKAVEASIEIFTKALEHGDFDTWSQYWAEDGILMPPDHPRVVGRANIEAFLRENYHDVLSITHTEWRIEGSGELAVVINDIDWRSRMADGTAKDLLGKQMLLLAKQPDGKWVRRIVIYNTN